MEGKLQEDREENIKIEDVVQGSLPRQLFHWLDVMLVTIIRHE
jgi:hypothetical protein